MTGKLPATNDRRHLSPVTHVIPPGARRSRADKVLAAAFPEHSRSAFQRAFAAGLVMRGGSAIEASCEVAPGDGITFTFPEVRPANMEPAEIPLAILYEDDQMLAIDKAAGMVVHPGAGTGGDTLVHALLAHCRGNLSGVGGVERPGIVHRLDRETTGIVVVAKTDAAHRGLAAQFSGRTVIKEYLALASGVPELLSGTIARAIGRNPRQRHKMAVVEEGGAGRDARTDWVVAEAFGSAASLLRCRIHTGRTHQIRVHLKFAGHPILGDRDYGWRPPAGAGSAGFPAPPRVMLHAAHLVLSHPVSGAALDLRAPLPADFERVMAALRAMARPASRQAPRSPAARPHRRL